ncbi:cytochrome P450 [Halobacillus sp. A1]|uniref:cytochrome P450 n=1 Tax=Halobacillus sp. A1 TaxID=2880262 RepID=UPI0020A61DF8|nr:cytochrome P450 [Halobacillus sp. A1]MCP3030087.1 cytochrome P450 [Halobacillus sp. A1]
MKTVPKDRKLDQSINVLREGYRFLPKRFADLDTDIFETRLLGEKVICLTGENGAKLFYDKEKFQRKGALPKRIEKSLFGENAIQGMDGDPHEHRKLLFMSLMTPEKMDKLGQLTSEQWRKQAEGWKNQKNIVLLEEAKIVLCQAACQWAGVPLKEGEVKKRAELLWAMVDAFGAVGSRHRKGRKARVNAEKWIKELIENIREGKVASEEGSAIYEMAFHRDLDGNHLSTQVAAKELLNVIRPTVAVAAYVAFGALALHDHAEEREKVKEAQGDYIERFAQEIRRLFPFVPFLGARVRKDFMWDGYSFEKDTLVLIDVHGIDHDRRLWERPNQFSPERFKDWKGGLFDFIPQGGGEHYTGHRCPGEWITMEAIKSSLKFLTREIEYEVPSQDLSYSLSRMPSFPKSGFRIEEVEFK